MDDLDFSSIDIPTAKDPRIFSGKLSQLDYAKLKVIGELIHKSQAAISQTALLTYLDRNWPKHYQRLCAEAKQKGLTAEEYFQELVNK